jgi:L-iditol 2-dehydrogenase
MEKMHVAVYYKNNDVRYEEMPIPVISENELLVKVMASGVCGSDVMEWYRIKKAPIVLGHEIAGEIIKTGRNIKKFGIGDRVFVTHHVPCNTCRYCINQKHTLCHTLHSTKFYPGGFSEYLRVPEINVDRGTFILPDEINYDQGTFIEPLACAVRGFRIAGFNPAQSVLVIGSGVAGVLNIKLARSLGASKIFATDINSYRLGMAKKNGADVTINAKENIIDIIKLNNDGRLADFVFLCAGAGSAIKQSINAVEPGGTLLLFAPTKPGDETPIDVFEIWDKQISIYSTYAGVGKDIIDAIELIRNKKIVVEDMITHRYSLENADKGFMLAAEAKNSMKIVIYPHKNEKELK